MTQVNDFIDKRCFIINLGKALHKFGTPAYRLEAHLENVANLLQVQASFIVTPTALTFVISDGDPFQEKQSQEYNHVVRVKPGQLDLGALARTDELVDELDSGLRDLPNAIKRLEEISNKATPYGYILTFSAYVGASGAFAMLMQTSWNDIFWSALLGFVVCLFSFWAKRSKRVTDILEPLTAVTTAFIASAIALIDPSINIPLVVLSSLIVFIPGLALTIGLNELSARHLISGTARIMDAAMILFKLYFGAFLGMSIATLLWGEVTYIVPHSASLWTSWVAVTTLSISLVILFNMRSKDAPWGIISGYIAFSASMWGDYYLGSMLGAFAGAFVLGLYSNIFSRLMKLPSTIVKLIGLVVLVTGSKVYIGLNAAISGQQILADSLGHTDGGSQTLMIFISLVAGLIFANVAVPTRKTL